MTESTEKRYWDDLYQRGGISGEGSTGSLKKWKWGRIGQLHEVLDYGCGDLSFFDGLYSADTLHYTGVDVSPTIINRNQRARPGWCFYTVEEWRRFAGLANRFDTVLCLDVLFHILDDDEYRRVLDTLFMHSKRRVVIYTWGRSPFTRRHAFEEIIKKRSPWALKTWIKYLVAPKDGDGRYQRFRPIASIFETAHHQGFHIRRVSSAPDGIGVLLDYRRDLEAPEYSPTGSGPDFPVGMDEGGREIG